MYSFLLLVLSTFAFYILNLVISFIKLYGCHVFLENWPFTTLLTLYYIILSNDYCFKVYSVWYWYSCTIFLLLNICLVYIFHLFIFNISGSLHLKYVFYEEAYNRFCFDIQSIYILIVVFSCFTLNDTTDIIWFKSLTYSLFSIFPPILCSFFSPFFSFFKMF